MYYLKKDILINAPKRISNKKANESSNSSANSNGNENKSNHNNNEKTKAADEKASKLQVNYLFSSSIFAFIMAQVECS